MIPRTTRGVFLMLFMIGSFCTPVAFAQSCPELAGRWAYGPASAVAVSGNYAYFGSGMVLQIVDVSFPAAPQLVGEVVLPDIVDDVALSGGYAYVADRSSGLRVIDISTPVSPTEVGSFDAPTWNSYRVAVSGSYAYVTAASAGGLRVIDISTPESPTEVGFYNTPGSAIGVAVSGGYAYVADGYSGLRVIDISIPNSPTEIGFYDTPGYARGVAVSGGYAYLSDGSAGMAVFRDCSSIFIDDFESSDTSAWSSAVNGSR